jgi:hypothetical protein
MRQRRQLQKGEEGGLSEIKNLPPQGYGTVTTTPYTLLKDQLFPELSPYRVEGVSTGGEAGPEGSPGSSSISFS